MSSKSLERGRMHTHKANTEQSASAKDLKCSLKMYVRYGVLYGQQSSSPTTRKGYRKIQI